MFFAVGKVVKLKYFTNLLIYDCKCYDRSDSETVFHTTLIWQQAIMKRIKHIDWTLGICSLILLRYILPISESLAEKKSWTKHLEKWPINRFYLKMLLRKNCYSRWLLMAFMTIVGNLKTRSFFFSFLPSFCVFSGALPAKNDYMF